MIKPLNNKLSVYDLEERSLKLAEKTIKLVKKLKINVINEVLIKQLVRSVCSIGANYCEANEGESKKDFLHKVKIAKKETKETQHWLRLLATCEPNSKEDISVLWKETHELLLIFSKIIVNTQKVK